MSTSQVVADVGRRGPSLGTVFDLLCVTEHVPGDLFGDTEPQRT
jgi:hypothetical protein